MAKVMISMPDDLLSRVDLESERRSSSRSALIREAVLKELGRPDRDSFDAALKRSRARFKKAGCSFDSGELIRAERERLGRRHL